MKLKEIRKAAGFTQQKLADKIGVSRSTVAMWESDSADCGLEMATKLASLFDVSVDYLLGRDVPASTVDLSGIDYALSGEIHDLDDDEKQDILDYVRFKKAQRKKNET